MKKAIISLVLALTQMFVFVPSSIYAKSETISVIVELAPSNEDSANEYASKCAKYVSELFPGSEYGYIYDTILCGFELTVSERSLPILKSLDFVDNVYTCAEYEPMSYSQSDISNFASEMVGYYAAKESGLTGDGVKVAVIDSGFDVTHPAFDVEVTETLDLSRHASRIGTERIGALRYIVDWNKLRHNSKIPFKFDYADYDTDVLSEETHGTHVAGIIGAVPSDTSDMHGIAPGCQLLLMKIFSDSTATASDAALIAALEDAIKLEADVINLSLGHYAGSTDINSIIGLDKLITKAQKSGTVIVCAVGNDSVVTESSKLSKKEGIIYPLASYTDYGTLSFPATVDYPIAVTSIDNRVVYEKHFRHAENRTLNIAFTDTNQASGVIFEGFNEHFDGRTLEYIPIPGLGEEKDYAGLNLSGKLALVERGTITFVDKVNAAAAHGALGVIVYNNVDGEYSSMELSGAKIPAVFISHEDGLALIAEANRKVEFSSDFTAHERNENAGMISDFSSYGCTPSLTLKPDISAVGGGVLSAVNGGTYESSGGTSMAAPQVSGICALLIEAQSRQGANYRYGRADKIKNALMNSAVPLIQSNGIEYSPRAQGAGVVSIPAALEREIEIVYADNGKPKAELFDKLGDVITVSLNIKNLTDSPINAAISATLTSDGYTELEFEGKKDYYSTLEAKADTVSKITVGESGNLNRYADDFSPLTLSLDAGESRTVSLAVTLDKGYHNTLDSIFTNGHFAEGFIFCETENTTASLPYMGYIGDWSAAPVIDADFYKDETEMFNSTKLMVQQENGGYIATGVNRFAEPDIYDVMTASFSPNGDGYADDVYLTATNIRNVRSAVFTVTDSKGNELHQKKYDYLTKRKATDNTVVFKFSWNGGDGMYARYRYPDGQYTITVVYTLDYGTDITQTYSYPITIDTTLPTVSDISYSDGILSISAEDANGIYGIYVYEAGNAANSIWSASTPSASFDISDYEGSRLYYEIIDCAYNVRVGRINLLDFGA